MSPSSKYQLKIRTKTHFDWRHFCYIRTSVKKRFDKLINTRGWLNNQWVGIWAKEDFGFTGKIEVPEDIYALKKAVKEYFKNKYPELYIEEDDSIMKDSQGWIGVWVMGHMEKLLKERRDEIDKERAKLWENNDTT